MRVVSIHDERERGNFAERAAAKFAENPKLGSYTDGEIEPDAFLALRWGLHDRAVLVLKIGDMVPVVYMDLVPSETITPPST